jgi:putative transposase
VGRARILGKPRDFEAFEEVIVEAKKRLPLRLLAWCVMSNHWHLVLWPRGDGDLSEFMRWLTVTHTQRWHAAHRTSGTGPLYQGLSWFPGNRSLGLAELAGQGSW